MRYAVVVLPFVPVIPVIPSLLVGMAVQTAGDLASVWRACAVRSQTPLKSVGRGEFADDGDCAFGDGLRRELAAVHFRAGEGEEEITGRGFTGVVRAPADLDVAELFGQRIEERESVEQLGGCHIATCRVGFSRRATSVAPLHLWITTV